MQHGKARRLIREGEARPTKSARGWVPAIVVAASVMLVLNGVELFSREAALIVSGLIVVAGIVWLKIRS